MFSYGWPLSADDWGTQMFSYPDGDWLEDRLDPSTMLCAAWGQVEAHRADLAQITVNPVLTSV